MYRALVLPPAVSRGFLGGTQIGAVAHGNELIADPKTRIFRWSQRRLRPTEGGLVTFAERATCEPSLADKEPRP